MLHLLKRTLASVTGNKIPNTDELGMFPGTNGLWYSVDSAGNKTLLGRGIKSVALQGTSGLAKTYRITLDDDSTFDFTITDGAAGVIQTVNGKTGAAVTLNASDVGADASGAAAAARAAHEAASDPHLQYLTEGRGNARYDALGAATSAVATHVGASDPHPQYTTAGEAAAAAPVQSVDGRAGAVSFLRSTRSAEFVSTANNATVQAVLSLVVPAARVAAGLTLMLELWGTQTNVATSGGNNSVLVQVNGTTIATATVAVGTTAQTNRNWSASGLVAFRASQVVASVEQSISGVLQVSGSNAAAPTATPAGDVTIALAVQTATANAGNTIRVGAGYIAEV